MPKYVVTRVSTFKQVFEIDYKGDNPGYDLIDSIAFAFRNDCPDSEFVKESYDVELKEK